MLQGIYGSCLATDEMPPCERLSRCHLWFVKNTGVTVATSMFYRHLRQLRMAGTPVCVVVRS